MPEALTANTRKQVSAIVGESSCAENNDNSNYVEDEIWGFRITGGTDFGIPITVFHVTQGSRANQAGIKLGDTIVKINDTDTKDMSLAEANQRIQDAGNDIKLSVRSFEEDESNENEQHEIAMEKKKENDRAALEEKLRAMKMRLAQIAQIPLIIQSTLDSVSKTFDGFLPAEPEPQMEIQPDPIGDDDAISVDSLDASDAREVNQDFEDDAVRSELSLTVSEYSKCDERAKEDFPESEHEPTPEPTEEQILKMEKQVKMQELERSWPWGDQQKKVYKRSNYQMTPGSSLIQNRNAKHCNAVKHCIQTVWETHKVPEDTDSICKICLDMVGQARDQLESNETQEDLKAVFEGSCNLIPVKLVRKECDKLADDFIPELVEALASQMDPQAVCTVAGLCNNAAIDKMLEEMKEETVEVVPTSTKKLSCEQCNSVGSLISQKFHGKSRDDVLDSLLGVCGKLSSFSDACANIVLVYFNEIYNEMNRSFNSGALCHLAGVCADNYHQHAEVVEIRPRSDVGFVAVGDDIPCELCEQLVRHLRDLLIANTTETEFKQVLKGLCKQTKGFKDECLSIVDQYYDVIYSTLVKDLNENEACCLMEICPRGLGKSLSGTPFMPLLPVDTAHQVEVAITARPKKFLLGEGEPSFSAQQIQSFQLPIDTLLSAPNPELLVDGGDWCPMCEYFLHFVQETMASPKTEENIKKTVAEACGKLPQAITETCRSFVQSYGDALIALLIQEIDPKDICPRLYMCPDSSKDVEVFAPHTIDVTINAQNSRTEKCPLCLFAVQEAVTLLKDDKSTENIKRTLKGLCSHLTNKLRPECNDFVETYTSELLNMLADDFTPQQICVYLKLCTDTKLTFVPLTGGDIETNEIPDYTYNGQPIKTKEVEYVATPNCILCEQIVKEVEKNIHNKSSKEDIKRALQHACDRLHKLKNKCTQIITKYGDEIIDLLLKEMTPKAICSELGMCIAEDNLLIDEALQVSVIAIPSKIEQSTAVGQVSDSPSCVICEYVMTQLETELKDKETQTEIENSVRNICKKLPKTVSDKCTKFVNDYGALIITLLATSPPKELCIQMHLCAAPKLVESKVEVIECAICHASTQTLAKILEDPTYEHDVEHLVEKICTKLPGKYYERCITLVESYGQSMINIITKGELQTVCSQIGMCYPDEYQSFVQIERSDAKPTADKKPHLLGDSKCTYGPSYWCSHVDNAKDCDATKYCETNGWLTNL